MNATTSDETLAEGPLASGARIGSYQIERRLGAGGMGTVYAARHVGLDKPVVIKTLSPLLAGRPESVLRFVREGRAASKIRHPHVVDVTDVGTHDGIPYLVMEFLDGEDLDTRLKAVHRFTDAEIARIMLPVCDAVATAHDLGVIHRDLKPGNIFLARGPSGRETPLVLDFGLAKIFDEERKPDRVSITRAATFLGTPYYASPEQAQSGSAADAKSDQYSLGAIMYELATGKRTVHGANPYEVLCAIIAGQTTPIRSSRSDVSVVLESIVQKAMAHRRDDRFESVRDLARALLAIADPGTRAQWTPVFDPAAAMSHAALPPSAGARDSHEPTMDAPSPGLVTGPLEGFRSSAPNSPRRKMAEEQHVAPNSSPQPAAQSAPPAFQNAITGPLQTPAFAPTADVRTSAPSAPPSVVAIAPAPKRSRLGLAMLAVAIMACLVAVPATYWWWTKTQSAATTEPAPISIAVAPETASVELDGRPAGTGAVRLPRDGQTHRVRVSAPGHVTQEIAIGPAETPPRSIRLEVEAPRIVEPEPVAPEPIAEPTPPPVVAPPEPVPPVANEVAPPAPTPRPRSQPRVRPTIAPYGGGPAPMAPVRPSPQPSTGRNNSPILW